MNIIVWDMVFVFIVTFFVGANIHSQVKEQLVACKEARTPDISDITKTPNWAAIDKCFSGPVKYKK
jgi:hypothetical protein